MRGIEGPGDPGSEKTEPGKVGGRRWPARLLQVAAHLACAVPLAWIAFQLFEGRIRGDWIKEITHRTGLWGITFIIASLTITPLRRLFGLNLLAPLRRPLGLWGFAAIATHFLIYVVLDRQIPFEPDIAIPEVWKDIAKRPYITVGFTGFLLLIPLALTSTRGWIRRLGRRWTGLHALVYVAALAGVVHFTWAVKADTAVPARFGAALLALLALRLVPARALAALGRLTAAAPRRGAARGAARAEPELRGGLRGSA